MMDSPTLAKRARDTFDRRLPLDACRVTLAEGGSLVWNEQRGRLYEKTRCSLSTDQTFVR